MKTQTREIQQFIRRKKASEAQDFQDAKHFQPKSKSYQVKNTNTQAKNFFGRMKQQFAVYKNTNMSIQLTQILRDNKKFQHQLKRLDKKEIINMFFQLSNTYVEKSISYQILIQILKFIIDRKSISQLEFYCGEKANQLGRQNAELLSKYISSIKKANLDAEKKSFLSSTSFGSKQSSIQKIEYDNSRAKFEAEQKGDHNKSIRRQTSITVESMDHTVLSQNIRDFSKKDKVKFNQKTTIANLQKQISNLKNAKEDLQKQIKKNQMQIKQRAIIQQDIKNKLKVQEEQIRQQDINNLRQNQIQHQRQKCKAVSLSHNQKIQQLTNKLQIAYKQIQLQKLESKYDKQSLSQIGQKNLCLQNQQIEHLAKHEIYQKQIQKVKAELVQMNFENSDLKLQNQKLLNQMQQLRQTNTKLSKSIELIMNQRSIKIDEKEKYLVQDQLKDIKSISNTSQNQQQLQIINRLKQKIKKLDQVAVELRIKYLLESSDILTLSNFAQKKFLIQNLEELYGPFNRFKLIFQYNKNIKANLHQYIDERPNFLALIQLANGVIIGGYSHQSLKKGQKSYDGVIFSLTDKEFYPLKTKYVLTYDQYFLIFGNSQIRIRIFEDVLFSNFGILNAHFDTKGKKVQDFIKYQKQRQILIKRLQIFQIEYTPLN